MGERVEALLRIVIGIVSGFILGIWKILIQFMGVINFIWTLVSGNRIREFAHLSEIWNTQFYVYLRYMTFVTNKRPIPFGPVAKSISTFS